MCSLAVRFEKKSMLPLVCNLITCMLPVYLHVGPPQVDVVAPLCLKTAVLLRFGMDKLLHVWHSSVPWHEGDGGRYGASVAAAVESVGSEETKLNHLSSSWDNSFDMFFI